MSDLLLTLITLAAVVGTVVFAAFGMRDSFRRRAGERPWTPECAEARIELRMARSITWDYDRFRYHLDKARLLEAEHQREKRLLHEARAIPPHRAG